MLLPSSVQNTYTKYEYVGWLMLINDNTYLLPSLVPGSGSLGVENFLFPFSLGEEAISSLGHSMSHILYVLTVHCKEKMTSFLLFYSTPFFAS